MVRGTRQGTGNITGPTSALTDFLASYNISAQQIRQTASERRQAAAQSRTQPTQADPTAAAGSETEAQDEDAYVEAQDEDAYVEDQDEDDYVEDQDEDDYKEEEEEEDVVVVAAPRRRRETKAQLERRKQQEKDAIEKIKASKKRRASDDDDDDDDDNDDDPLARVLRQRRRVPGQTANCAICDKRFTVTPYTRNGPDGGLLCSPCGRDLASEKPARKKAAAPKSVGGVGRRRAIQSRILDGTFALGAKPLVTLCVEVLAKNVELADSLGDLPDRSIDRIARLISKRRLLNHRTLPLFVRPSTQRLCIYDAAYLGEDDLVGTFAVAQKLKHLKIKNGIQFKDTVMDYMLGRGIALESMYLHGANLLSDGAWDKFLQQQGDVLTTLRIYGTDNHVGDHTVETIQKHCPNLRRLKIYHNQKMTNDGLKTIADLEGLEHLSLKLQNHTKPKAYVSVIKSLGPTLQTLSLRVVPHATDEVPLAIHTHCRNLSKLQITDSEHMTDEGFAHLFTDWDNPPLRAINFERCRHLDSQMPRDNTDGIGLGPDGFRALMRHSGAALERLNIHACRHISAEAFEDVFKVDEHGIAQARYPFLRDLEISFCEHVSPYIVRCIFRCCPDLRRLNVFGCMKVKDKGLEVPPTVNMVGGADAYGLRFES